MTMTDPTKVLKLADQYRANLAKAQDKDAIRKQQVWYQKKASPLFKK